MKNTLYESGYPCYPYDSNPKISKKKTVLIADSATKMLTKKLTPPPPLTIAECTTRRIQKDSVDVVSTAQRLTFDDLESIPKPPIKTRQGDSMTTRVHKVVNTPVVTAPAQVTDGTCRGQSAGNFAPIPQNYGHVSSDRQIAPLPENFKGNPHAIVVDAPVEIFRGMERPKRLPKMPTDMNEVLPCGNCYAPIKASDLINPNYRQAPPLVY